jgi:hypothetical protein
VEKLSSNPGTEKGVFEFDVPTTKSYVISISNRVFGTLVISNTNNPGYLKSYTGSGISVLTIRGDLIIKNDVKWAPNLANDIVINGEFVQEGGRIELLSGATSTTLKFKGNMYQSSTALLNQNSGGIGLIELCGTTEQKINMQGSITGDIPFRMNNEKGALLEAPLYVPYLLDMVKGNIKSSKENMLVLATACTIMVDSSSTNNGFIDGPMRKEGLSNSDYFIFPVGKGNEMNWLELKNATGDFTVEYMNSNPRNLSRNYGVGISHISSKGYWVVETEANASANANVELSFRDETGQDITELSSLKVAQLTNNEWMDRKNTGITGNINGSGSIISEPINNFVANAKEFTLASSLADQNPLPIKLLSFTAKKLNENILLNWEIDQALDLAHFEILIGEQANELKPCQRIMGEASKVKYDFLDMGPIYAKRYYQLKITEKNGAVLFSKILMVEETIRASSWITIAPNPIEEFANIIVHSEFNERIQIQVLSMSGRKVQLLEQDVIKGKNIIPIDFSRIPSGMYLIYAVSPRGQKSVLKLLKK